MEQALLIYILLVGLVIVTAIGLRFGAAQRGFELGPWAVSQTVFAHVVLVSAVTVLAVPLMLRPLLARHFSTTQPVRS